MFSHDQHWYLCLAFSLTRHGVQCGVCVLARWFTCDCFSLSLLNIEGVSVRADYCSLHVRTHAVLYTAEVMHTHTYTQSTDSPVSHNCWGRGGMLLFPLSLFLCCHNTCALFFSNSFALNCLSSSSLLQHSFKICLLVILSFLPLEFFFLSLSLCLISTHSMIYPSPLCLHLCPLTRYVWSSLSSQQASHWENPGSPCHKNTPVCVCVVRPLVTLHMIMFLLAVNPIFLNKSPY